MRDQKRLEADRVHQMAEQALAQQLEREFRNKQLDGAPELPREEKIRRAAEWRLQRVLSLTAHALRLMGGARIVSCKSAKDRTSMSLTGEQVSWG